MKHRIHIAWMKFNQHRETLLNRHVSLKLRLKFFDSIISPAILFGLTTVPLSAAQLSKLDIVRRRMLRSIVGWDPVVNGDWHDAMSIMNQKLQNAYRIYPTKSWPERILKGKFRFAANIACKANHWPVLCSRWQPGYFYEKNSMCNLVGAQVVHRSHGMINSGFLLNMFFIHHGRLLPVMGHNGCPMNRVLCNFVQNHDD